MINRYTVTELLDMFNSAKDAEEEKYESKVSAIYEVLAEAAKKGERAVSFNRADYTDTFWEFLRSERVRAEFTDRKFTYSVIMVDGLDGEEPKEDSVEISY